MISGKGHWATNAGRGMRSVGSVVHDLGKHTVVYSPCLLTGRLRWTPFQCTDKAAT